MTRSELINKVVEHFGRKADDVQVAFAPLRICPLGAHVDHQLGLVCGFALDKGIHIAFAPRDDDVVRLRSADFEGEAPFRLGAIPRREPGHWRNYAAGAAQGLVERFGIDRGLDGYVAGSLPTGGLGSSAAVGVAYLLALEAANGLEVSAEDNIELDRYTENVYLGLNNGILDQSITLLGKRGMLTFMDCETSQYETIAPGQGMAEFKIAIAYSGHSDSLVSTDYNQRVAECQAAAKALLEAAGMKPQADAKLRHVPDDVFDAHADKLEPKLRRRATHFFTECRRVRHGIEAWKGGDLEALGRLVRVSGLSSIENYECGRPELIAMYEILNDTPGIVGARFSGAGFRGSCLALVTGDDPGAIRQSVLDRYTARQPEVRDRADVFFCDADDGARLV